jgi:hypothetical protein
MVQERGRRSAVELATHLVAEPGTRPLPPEDFSGAEMVYWHRIVAALPADHFPDETLPLLSLLCTNIAQARNVEAELGAFPRAAIRDPDGRRDYRELARLLASATGSMISLSTRLRLTSQLKVSKRAAHTATRPTATPWEWNA